jgi:hypothetical protein
MPQAVLSLAPAPDDLESRKAIIANAVNRFLALYEIFIAISHFDRTKACPEHSRRVNPPKAVNEVEKSVFLIDSSAPQPRACLRQEDAGALRSE